MLFGHVKSKESAGQGGLEVGFKQTRRRLELRALDSWGHSVRTWPFDAYHSGSLRMEQSASFLCTLHFLPRSALLIPNIPRCCVQSNSLCHCSNSLLYNRIVQTEAKANRFSHPDWIVDDYNCWNCRGGNAIVQQHTYLCDETGLDSVSRDFRSSMVGGSRLCGWGSWVCANTDSEVDSRVE